MKNENYFALILFCGMTLESGCVTASKQNNVSVPQVIPLKLFWNGPDNYTVASMEGEKDAQAHGYQFVRVEGYVFANPQPGTVPLMQYWSPKRQDHALAVTLPKNVERNGNYGFVRIEGYTYSNAQPGTVELKLFTKPGGDIFTFTTPQAEKNARTYNYVQRKFLHAYVIPAKENLPRHPNTLATNSVNVLLTNKIEIVSADQIQNWIAQLGDPDFSKRENAVTQLAQHPTEALPVLKQALATTDNDRRWWIQSAIQECEENRHGPEEISASPDSADGLKVCEACKNGDGMFTVVERNGIRCWEVSKKGNYLYFSAGDEFRQKAIAALEIQVEFLDIGHGGIALDYDSTDKQALVSGAYKNHPVSIHCTNSGQWRSAIFHVSDARFQGSENGQTDFRFYNGGDDMIIHAVRVWPSNAAN
jgi:hypothetical protein